MSHQVQIMWCPESCVFFLPITFKMDLHLNLLEAVVNLQTNLANMWEPQIAWYTPQNRCFFLIQHQFKTCSNVMLIYPEETYSLYVLAYIVLSASSMFLDQTSCGKPTAINRSIHQPFQLVVVLHHPSHEGILKCHKPKRWFTNIIKSKQK